jgi:hypothetical protein
VITTKVITLAEGDYAKNGAPVGESDHGGPEGDHAFRHWTGKRLND